jgi:cell division protein FtsB
VASQTALDAPCIASRLHHVNGIFIPGNDLTYIRMRLITLSLATLLLLIQFPLWLGKGGWLRVWDLDKQVAAAQKKNNELRARNAKLHSEVSDLREGTDAVEERARYELGMIKDGEIFIQILEPSGKSDVQSTLPSSSSSARKN